MDSKIAILVLISLLSFASTIKAQTNTQSPAAASSGIGGGGGGASGGVFDITKYGGGARADITKALTTAWTEACAAAGSSKVLIPKGEYNLGLITMKGPCKGSIQVQVDGTIKAPSNLGGDSWITFGYVDGFTLSGAGTFDGLGSAAWEKNNCHKDKDCAALPMNLRFNFITNGMVRDVTTKDSKNFHVNVLGCKNFTFDHFNVVAPAESLNTDGIHIGRSNGITIVNSNIGTGDDCISMGDGCQQINITGVNCGPGHGISVGSLGKYQGEEPVEGIFVKNCTLTGTDNGVRIKTWPNLHGGTATNMHFEDIIMKDVANPVIIDQVYCPWNQCSKQAPSKVKVSDVSFKKIRGTSKTPIAVQISCSSGIPCEKVELADIDLTYNGPEGPAKSLCTNVKPMISGPLKPAGC